MFLVSWFVSSGVTKCLSNRLLQVSDSNKVEFKRNCTYSVFLYLLKFRATETISIKQKRVFKPRLIRREGEGRKAAWPKSCFSAFVSGPSQPVQLSWKCFSVQVTLTTCSFSPALFGLKRELVWTGHKTAGSTHTLHRLTWKTLRCIAPTPAFFT